FEANVCSTVYNGSYLDTTNTMNPKNDLLVTVRDGRSTSPTDNAFKTTYDYDATGNRTTVTDPLGRVTTTAYTTATTPAVGGGVTKPGLPLTVTSPGGAVQTFQYYANGDTANVTDAAGKVTTFTYDGLGRLASRTETTSTFPAGLTTTIGYDKQNRVTSQTAPAVTDRVTGAVHTALTTTVFDDDGHQTSQTITDTATGG